MGAKKNIVPKCGHRFGQRWDAPTKMSKKTGPLYVKQHVEKGVVEVTLDTEPRITLCLSASMSLGDAAAKIAQRLKDEKPG